VGFRGSGEAGQLETAAGKNCRNYKSFRAESWEKSRCWRRKRDRGAPRTYVTLGGASICIQQSSLAPRKSRLRARASYGGAQSIRAAGQQPRRLLLEGAFPPVLRAEYFSQSSRVVHFASLRHSLLCSAISQANYTSIWLQLFADILQALFTRVAR
jgi:hypothetical protein